MGYTEDRKESDRYLPAIKRIVGPLLLVESPLEVDQKQAADLIVMRARDMTIACRVRRAGYAAQYPWQFTIRAKRDSGAATELEKLTNGWGDWLFYGHAATGSVPEVSRWFVVDLSAWRAHLIRNKQLLAMGQKPNGDGTHFVWFDLRSFPPTPPILVASSHTLPVKEPVYASTQ